MEQKLSHEKSLNTENLVILSQSCALSSNNRGFHQVLSKVPSRVHGAITKRGMSTLTGFPSSTSISVIVPD